METGVGGWKGGKWDSGTRREFVRAWPLQRCRKETSGGRGGCGGQCAEVIPSKGVAWQETRRGASSVPAFLMGWMLP